ncbi:MAG TPA: acyl-CoA dehydrogenase family protein, partial [Thermoanaerobaculia bacterium]|nr:acyl-CoA dehydrogenase family protein [Thermoanaerobaculia bacterium]
MDFAPPPRVAALLPEVEAFVAERVVPLEPALLHGPFRDALPALEECRAEVRRRGWWLPQIAAEHGGMGLSLVEFGWLAAVLGQSPAGHYVFGCQAPDAGNLEILLELATPGQRERFARPLLSGAARSCFAMTEPERAGSNPVWMDTRARRTDGGGWAIDGRKWFASGADGAAFAVVMAVTDPDAPPHRRASLFLVPMDTPGFARVRNVPVMGHAGDGWASHGELAFEGCRVGPEALLGGEGEGFAIAQARLGPGRIHHAMRWIGVAERSLDLLCRRALAREIAPGEPLARRPEVAGWIADTRAEIDAARLAVLHAAWRIEREGARAARSEVSAIKFTVAGVMLRAVDRAIQAHGALGVSDDTVLSWFYRQERAARIYDGPDEVHRQSVARQI